MSVKTNVEEMLVERGIITRQQLEPYSLITEIKALQILCSF